VTPGVSRARLLTLVSSFAGRRLVVAGDYVLDRFIYGHPKRVSREAPVLILRFWKEENLPGGAGNTAANVRSLGAVPLPVGVLGDDESGRTVRRILSERGVDTRGLETVADYPTPTKTRILGGGSHSIKQQIVRFDREAEIPETRELRAALERRFREVASGAHAAILSDYGYGSVTAASVAPLRAGLPAQAPILVDSRHRLGSFASVDAVTPNEEELEEFVGESIGDSVDTLSKAACSLMRRLACSIVLVTRGSRGMALFQKNAEDPTLIPVHGTDQVADVTGAGDTVLATFSLALASGATPNEAAYLANLAGGVVVMKMGTATVTSDELREAIGQDRSLRG